VARKALLSLHIIARCFHGWLLAAFEGVSHLAAIVAFDLGPILAKPESLLVNTLTVWMR
jgi:hypothetical protein